MKNISKCVNIFNTKHVLFIIAIISLISCYKNVNSNTQDKKAIEEWHGKIVNLPWDTLKINFSGTESEFNLIKGKELKIISIINTNCMECIHKFRDWSLFIEGIDTSYVGFVFLLSSSDQFMGINDILDDINAIYPTFKDKNGDIMKMNIFPQENRYRTFLINNENKIQLLGSPNKNSKMFNLYRDKIDLFFRGKGIKGAVKGAITTEVNGMSKTRFVSKPKYYFENGETIDEEKARELISSLKYIPQINNLTGEVILKKR